MFTVIVRADTLDARTAAVVVKNKTKGDVEVIEVKDGKPFPRDKVANANQVWILGLDYAYSDLSDDGIVVLYDESRPIPIERNRLHVVLSQPYSFAGYHEQEGNWLTHGMEFAEVCEQLTPPEYTDAIPCPTCKDTGGKFLRGRSLCVATWLSLYPQVKTNCARCGGSGHFYRGSVRNDCSYCNILGEINPNPIPDPLLAIEDDVMGYGSVADSDAICLAIGTTLWCGGTDTPLALDYMMRMINGGFTESCKDVYIQYGKAILDYRRHLAERFGPIFTKLLDFHSFVEHMVAGMPMADTLDEIDEKLPELMAALGIGSEMSWEFTKERIGILGRLAFKKGWTVVYSIPEHQSITDVTGSDSVTFSGVNKDPSEWFYSYLEAKHWIEQQ